MAVGTPVIANDTGSIGRYLINGENGFLIRDLSEDSLIYVLNSLKKIDNDKYLRMRKFARSTAEKFFDYKTYLKELGCFFMEGSNEEQ